MRILFISHYFPPEVNAPASRTHEHCRQWVAEGHDVTVITGVPNHPSGVLFKGYRNRFIQEEQVDGIRVIRTWMLLTSNAGFAKRILNFLLFALMAVFASFKVKKPDVVIATSPQFFCGLAGAATARIKRRPFILEVRDLWPKSIVELDQLSDGPALSFLQWLERKMYLSADGIVVNTRAFVDHITELGYPEGQMDIVYNGIDSDRFKPRPPANELRARFDLEGRFTVGYIGTLGLAHGLGTLLEAAESLRDQPEIAFLLIGDGAELVAQLRTGSDVEQQGQRLVKAGANLRKRNKAFIDAAAARKKAAEIAALQAGIVWINCSQPAFCDAPWGGEGAAHRRVAVAAGQSGWTPAQHPDRHGCQPPHAHRGACRLSAAQFAPSSLSGFSWHPIGLPPDGRRRPLRAL